MPETPPPDRSEALRRQYEVERELAERLRAAPSEVRGRLYGEVYDELFRRLPDQPQLVARADSRERSHVVGLLELALDRFLDPGAEVADLGAGDCALAIALAQRVRRVVAIEPAPTIVPSSELPANVELLHRDATDPGLPEGSLDLAVSCHLVEHLHPEDAATHFAAVLRCLRPGGAYLCVTPHRLWGPHDVSRFFADEARGLHLREYGYRELGSLARNAGFTRQLAVRGVGTVGRLVSTVPHRLVEALVDTLPGAARRAAMRLLAAVGPPAPFRPLEQVKLLVVR